MAGSAGSGLSTKRRGLSLPVRAAERAVVQRRPVRGNSPDDRTDYPDFESSQESLRRCPPARPTTRTVVRRGCSPADEPRALNLAFLRHGGIYRSDVAAKPKPKSKPKPKPSKPGAGVPPPVGRPRSPVKGRDGRNCAPNSSSAMSSGRLFLDRVARQQSPSPLHRHPQFNMHSSGARAKGDISILLQGGHFYFALTFVHSALDTAAPRGINSLRSPLTPPDGHGAAEVATDRYRVEYGDRYGTRNQTRIFPARGRRRGYDSDVPVASQGDGRQ